jgi:hypothetical protein
MRSETLMWEDNSSFEGYCHLIHRVYAFFLQSTLVLCLGEYIILLFGSCVNWEGTGEPARHLFRGLRKAMNDM